MHMRRNSLHCQIVQTQAQFFHAMTVRSICFNHGEKLPYAQSFDGNDLCSTHVVCYDGDEPIGTLRVRWFADFAKIERTCVLPDYRTSPALKTMDAFVHEYIGKKGYKRSITHASSKYAKLWGRLFGYRINTDKGEFSVPGHETPYFELIKDIPPVTDALSIETDAHILSRVEGSWEKPSPLG